MDSPPGKIEDRVFIGGNYVLMPILREIREAVEKSRFVPIIACDFDIPREKIRDYTLRLLTQCQFQIIEITMPGGEIVEIERAKAFVSSTNDILLLYMARDETRSPPPTISIMTSQDEPKPQGYLTIKELRELVETFLLTKRIHAATKIGNQPKEK